MEETGCVKAMVMMMSKGKERQRGRESVKMQISPSLACPYHRILFFFFLCGRARFGPRFGQAWW